MKHATEYAKRLSVLLKRLRQAVAVSPPTPREPLVSLIHASLCWDTTHRNADNAYERIMRHVIDVNDLRVTDARDIAAVLDAGYPRAHERCARLKASLQSVYNREHAVDLSSLVNKPKKEARAYLETLEGMVQFVAASVMLLCFDGHAMPVDHQLLERLKKDHVVDHEATAEEAASFIEHHVRHEEAVEVYQLLRAYAEKSMRVDLGPVPKALLERPKAPEKPVAKPAAKIEPKPEVKPATKAADKPARAAVTTKPAKPAKAVAAKTAKKGSSKAPRPAARPVKNTKPSKNTSTTRRGRR